MLVVADALSPSFILEWIAVGVGQRIGVSATNRDTTPVVPRAQGTPE